MPEPDLLTLLAGGDRRSIGRAGEVAAIVSAEPARFSELLEGMWNGDPVVSMRAADAVEKVTRVDTLLLQPHKSALLSLLAEAVQQELRWHLALIVPRLKLNRSERDVVARYLTDYLEDRSSIVKTFALQGLADLAREHPDMRPSVVDLLQHSARTGTAAMKARSRKLLAQLT